MDILQEKIRKMKSPVVVDLSLACRELPPHLTEQECSPAAAYGRFCREILEKLKGTVPAARFSFAAFCAASVDGLKELAEVLQFAKNAGYYTLLDAPLLTPVTAEAVAESVFGENAAYPCDGLIISSYQGSECIKPFLPFCSEKKKNLFCIVRTSNKSGAELQDLLTGSRLVHLAAADLVNRFGADSVGKTGYAGVGVVAGGSSAQSLKNLRTKYPRLFMLIDDIDYSCCNAKICADAFDRFGYGAAVCVGASITCAWKKEESDGTDYLDHAAVGADKARKNLTRYITIL